MYVIILFSHIHLQIQLLPENFSLLISPTVASDTAEYYCLVNDRHSAEAIVDLLVQGKFISCFGIQFALKMDFFVLFFCLYIFFFSIIILIENMRFDCAHGFCVHLVVYPFVGESKSLWCWNSKSFFFRLHKQIENEREREKLYMNKLTSLETAMCTL